MTLTYEDLTGVLVGGEPLNAELFEGEAADSDVQLIDILAGKVASKVVGSETNLDYGFEDLDLLPSVVTVPKFKFTPGAGHIPKQYK